jgi:hypothetical protein
MKQLILGLLLAIAIVELNAQSIVTDRPDQTESSVIVPQKSFQIESGVLFENYESNSFKRAVLPTALFRYGVNQYVELRLFEQLEHTRMGDVTALKYGLSDLELGAKFQLLSKDEINTRIALVTHILLPTGASQISNDKWGLINKLALSHQLNSFMGLGYNLGYSYLGVGKGNFHYSASLGFALAVGWGTYLELYGVGADFETWNLNFDAGLTYAPKKNLQFDASLGRGMDTNWYYFALGISWNINAYN